MSQVVIQALRDGPLLVKGPIQLLDGDGKVMSSGGEAIGLCRCGQSSSKPFCDGCHREGRFQMLPLL
jgi:CDGSH-type Zn-finger protein